MAILPLFAVLLTGASLAVDRAPLTTDKKRELEQRIKRLFIEYAMNKSAQTQERLMRLMLSEWPHNRERFASFVTAAWLGAMQNKARQDFERADGSVYYTDPTYVYFVTPKYGRKQVSILLKLDSNGGEVSVKTSVELGTKHYSTELESFFPGEVWFSKTDGVRIPKQAQARLTEMVGEALDARRNAELWVKWKPSRAEAADVLLGTKTLDQFQMVYHLLADLHGKKWRVPDMIEEPALRAHLLQLAEETDETWAQVEREHATSIAMAPATWELPVE